MVRRLQITLLVSSSTATGTELTVSGVVILVTMTSNKTNNRTRLDSGFALKFLCTQNEKVLPPERVLYPTTFVTGEERQIASFPENSIWNYVSNANHLMVISREDGRDFHLTTTFLDTESWHDYFRVFGIEDEAEKTRFIFKTL